MSVAERVISKFGGQVALATAIGKRQSTVQHWKKTGLIPARWQSTLLQVARERGIDLGPSDFIESTNVPVPGYESDGLPVARWPGTLSIGLAEIQCYVLDDGRRVISRTGATATLTGGKGGGNLESYLEVEGLKDCLPHDWSDKMIEFTLPEVVNKTVRGIRAETFLDICTAYVKALEQGALQTERQIDIAKKAALFLAACSEIGLVALIDEATGYQYERAQDALQLKLKLYLEDEMRKWEKTFPDELWREFGRLTHWSGPVTSRPKYWGKLVMELVYEYLDHDVADWLRNNAPKPIGNLSYHRWLTSQYGLRKLIEHIWMLIGIASTCGSMSELRQRMAEKFGRQPVQLRLFLPPQA